MNRRNDRKGYEERGLDSPTPPLPFAPGATISPPSPRTFNDAIEDAKKAPQERLVNAMKRRYRSRGTPETRKITQRIVGEGNE